MTTVEDILGRHPDKEKFAEAYLAADSETRELLNALVDYAIQHYPDLRVYPTNTPDFRLTVMVQVCATVQIKKHYLRLFLLNIRNPLPDTHLEFRKSESLQLKSNVYVRNKNDFDDATRYIDRTIQNCRNL